MATPQITLTANLQTIAEGGMESGFIRVTLCGYGRIVPAVPGTSMLADAGVPQIVGPQTSAVSPLTVHLYGNDVITPAGTFYEVAIMDANSNVIQAENYIFTGSGDFDLSTVPPIVPPYGFPANAIVYEPCTGSALNWTAPGRVIAASYNGILLPEGASFPTNSYTLDSTGKHLTLNFLPEAGDRIDAICVF